MIGKTISHYKILEELGRGGMGVVYKAQDTKLQRFVAIKVLPSHLTTDEEAKTRFVREARAASALEHPNICHIHEIDETSDGHLFMVMPCYEGETLRERLDRGPLEIDEALDIATQIVSALARAHEKEIVHRDIKPGNVMLTESGRQVKLMDFGLAKRLDATKVTRTGTAIGTVAYMSPEQALGKKTDYRADIWALGVVLYEMLTGRQPFRGEYEPAVLYLIMKEKPEPITAIKPAVPLEVERVVGKALTKNLDKRYHSAEELKQDLEELRESLDLLPKRSRLQLKLIRRKRQIAIAVCATVAIVVLAVLGVRFFSGRVEAIDSIAVLPLENLMGGPEQEYFVDGMTDALITELSKIGALSVTSRTSVMQYKGVRKPLPEIARELDVDAIVEGTVLREGNQVRITAQLIHASTDKHLWADQYDRELRDILALHSEVAQAIAREIRITMTPEEEARLASTRPVNPEAHDLYLKAQYKMEKMTKEAYEKAVEYYQKAIEIDPNYAQAYAGLASCYVYHGYWRYMPVKEAFSRGKAYAKKALEIDGNLSEAHFALAVSRFQGDWNWVGAEEEFKQSIELNPNLAEAHNQYAWLLTAMDRFEEAIAEAKRDLQLDPVPYFSNMTLAWVYYCARQYDQAIERFQQITELEQNRPGPYRGLAMVYEQTGMYEDAVRARQQAMILSGDPPEEVAALDSAYSESGPKGYWMWRLERLKGQYERYPTITAGIYARLGDKDQAFIWLEKGYEKHDGPIYLLKVIPWWDSLRGDPRFQDILRRMNFPENETREETKGSNS